MPMLIDILRALSDKQQPTVTQQAILTPEERMVATAGTGENLPLNEVSRYNKPNPFKKAFDDSYLGGTVGGIMDWIKGLRNQ